MSDNPQLSFALQDEERALTSLDAVFRCPVCDDMGLLYRVIVEGKPRFFVECWSAHMENRVNERRRRCTAPRVPLDGAPSSAQAVQAWKLVCALSRRD